MRFTLSSRSNLFVALSALIGLTMILGTVTGCDNDSRTLVIGRTAAPTPSPATTPASTATPVTTPAPTPPATPTPSSVATGTLIPTPTGTLTPSPSRTPIPTGTLTPSPSRTPIPTGTPTPSPTGTPRTPTASPTHTPTPTPTTGGISFAAHQDFATGAGAASSVTAADINGDGKPDLIVANREDDSVSVLLNTTPPGAATPSFAAQRTFATGQHPAAVTTADVNGDGKPDLIVANGGDNTFSVLLNTTAPGAATPGFTSQRRFFSGTDPTSVTAVDINGDGKPDVIVANYGDDTVSVLLNTTAPDASTPSFASPQTFATGSHPQAVTAADLNGDGKPDLIVANLSDNTVSVLLNVTAPDGPPSFTAQQTFPTEPVPVSVTAADVNGDGKLDLMAVNDIGYSISVLLNTTEPNAGNASFAVRQSFSTGAFPQSGTAADVNGDGKPDAIVANGLNSTLSVLVNMTAPGAATPTFAAQQMFATAGGLPVSVTAADINGDGKPDLIVANEGLSTVSVLLNTTVPFPPLPTPEPTPTATPPPGPSPTASETPVPLHGTIYVSNDTNQTGLTEYDLSSSGNIAPIAQITGPDTGIGAGGIALDAVGDIYTTGPIGSGNLLVFAPDANGDAIPITIIRRSVDPSEFPSGVAIDTKGNIYTTRPFGGFRNQGAIAVYAAGAHDDATPIAVITGADTQLDDPEGITLDAQGNIYVANYVFGCGVSPCGSITKYPAGSNGNVSPIAVIARPTTGDQTQLFKPLGIALDATGNIYVTNVAGGPPSPLCRNGPACGSVTEYAAGSAGNVAPIASIEGNNTGLYIPEGIALDSQGNIYVANGLGGPPTIRCPTQIPACGSITKYAAGSNGNVSPLTVIAGDETRLSNPTFIAIRQKDKPAAR